ncbi:MAG TPA: hypothetical protein VKS79_24985 [Gemmataceae bacterium]|nr:hypothetical protein [Gemmataceae bacterium]
MFRAPRWLALPGVLTCVALSGCIPNVVWLPDSTGFVFSESGPAQPGKEPNLRLVKYDIAKKQRDIIVDNLKQALTTWPAINPAGTEIAVASVTWKGDQTKLQLTFYDTTGKELRTSKEYDWVEKKKENDNDSWPTLVFWCTAEKVLVTPIHSDVPTITAIIDLKSKEIVKVKDRFPFFYPGNIPCRPDGKGFLAMGDKNSGLFFVDWDGKETKLEIKEAALDAANNQLVDFRWNGNKAIIIGSNESFTVDTETAKVSKFDPPPLQDPGKEGERIMNRLLFAGDRFEFRPFARMQPNQANQQRLEVRDQKSGKVRVLLDNQTDCFVFPSPDKKWLAVRTQGKILLINDQGEIAAEVEAVFK